MSKTTSAANGWSRANVNVRLSARRRADLLSLSGGAEALAPTEAIDLAIRLAKQALRDEARNRVDAGLGHDALRNLSGQLLSLAGAANQNTLDSRELLEAIADQTRELRDVIIAAASERERGDDTETNPNEESRLPMISLRAWLDQETLGMPRPTLLARVSWVASKLIAPGCVRVELSAKRQAPTGSQSANGFGVPTTVALDLPRNAESPVRWDQPGAYYLQCQRETNGPWRLGLRLAMADGKLAPVTAAFTLRR